ncbi:MAG: hypothetical protein DME34_00635 [Verrucomicrobia bacterium]|nr:MAG: hypothetical protein DME34_00635 [Verrucomicrobiota bacterium]
MLAISLALWAALKSARPFGPHESAAIILDSASIGYLDDAFFNGAQPEGALTLRKCESFEVGQRPAWSADQILSADILFAATLDANAPAPRRWRPNEARISLMGDATSGSAIRFEN